MQERHLPDSQPQRRPLGRRLGAISATVAAAALALTATGCPTAADLDNAGDYPKGPMDMMPMPMGCESPCITQLFTVDTVCSGCHNPDLKSAMLDLKSPNFTARLSNVAATHADVKMPSACPSGDKLIDTTNPAQSWLWKKINKQQGMCGDPMPQSGGLGMAQMTCVKDYISCVAGKPLDGGSGGSGAGGSGGSSAGGSGGSSAGSSAGGATGGGGGATGGGGAANAGSTMGGSAGMGGS